jgi:hypothetical protein
MLDSVEGMIIEAFKNYCASSSYENVNSHLTETLADSLPALRVKMSCESEEFANFQQNFNTFKDEVRQGKLVKTAQFWLNYWNSIWLHCG